MRILLWYAHGSYVNALVRGPHRYVFLDRDPSGAGIPQPTMPWPAGIEITSVADVRAERPDLVIIQRLEEIDFCQRELGFEPGRDVPAIFLEHNTPGDRVPSTRHPLADAEHWLIAHVTRFNSLMWDCGSTPTTFVAHGVPDPGPLYQGDLPRAGFVANEPVRRFRPSGADLIPAVAGSAGVDAYGMAGDQLRDRLPGVDLRWVGNFALGELHELLARDRLYLHLTRWTSLGLSLLEAMHLSMPVVVLGTTEAATLPPEIGAVSTDLGHLRQRVAALIADPDEARRCGQVARAVALERYGLPRFLTDWDQTYEDCRDAFGHRALRPVKPAVT